MTCCSKKLWLFSSYLWNVLSPIFNIGQCICMCSYSILWYNFEPCNYLFFIKKNLCTNFCSSLVILDGYYSIKTISPSKAGNFGLRKLRTFREICHKWKKHIEGVKIDFLPLKIYTNKLCALFGFRNLSLVN
jgi:hypothetical protein